MFLSRRRRQLVLPPRLLRLALSRLQCPLLLPPFRTGLTRLRTRHRQPPPRVARRRLGLPNPLPLLSLPLYMPHLILLWHHSALFSVNLSSHRRFLVNRRMARPWPSLPRL